MNGTDFVTIWAITVICYLVAEGVKATHKVDEWIPIICGVLGGILGVVAMYTMTNFPADDIMNAVATGILSGFAATGVHQGWHQQIEKH